MSDKDKGTAAERPLVRRLILAAAVLVTLAAVAAQAAVPTSQRQAGAVPGLWYWELPDTPNGLRPTQSWSGAGSAPDGAIYVGGMDHTTNAALYRLEPGGDASVPALTLSYVGDARAASEAAHNWKPGEVAEKFHTHPTWYGGRVYVASLNYSGLDDGYKKVRAFHWYAYDETAGTFTDLSATEPGGTGAPLGGIISIVPEAGKVYGAMSPTGGLYAYEVASGQSLSLGRPAYDRDYVYPGRAMWTDRRGRVYFSDGNQGKDYGAPYDARIFNHVRYYAPGRGFVELTGWKLHDERAIDAAQCFPHVCYLDDNVGHVYRFDDPAPGSPHWTYLGSIGARTVDKFGKSKVFQVAHDESVAYLGTTRGLLFRMDLRTGRATGPVDLTKLDASFKGFQLYGFDAWDEVRPLLLLRLWRAPRPAKRAAGGRRPGPAAVPVTAPPGVLRRLSGPSMARREGTASVGGRMEYTVLPVADGRPGAFTRPPDGTGTARRGNSHES